MEYDRIIIELLNRVSVLEERLAALEKGPISNESAKVSKKYRKLTDYLVAKEACGVNEIRLSFSEIENILGFELPDSKKHKAFWANTESHPIALAWLCTSFKTVESDVDSEVIVWEKRRI